MIQVVNITTSGPTTASSGSFNLIHPSTAGNYLILFTIYETGGSAPSIAATTSASQSFNAGSARADNANTGYPIGGIRTQLLHATSSASSISWSASNWGGSPPYPIGFIVYEIAGNGLSNTGSTINSNATLNTGTANFTTSSLAGTATWTNGNIVLVVGSTTTGNTVTGVSAGWTESALGIGAGTYMLTSSTGGVTVTYTFSGTSIWAYGALVFSETSPPSPPVVTSATVDGQVCDALTYDIQATNSPTSYSATGLPSGLSLNTSTGAITGTPTIAGTFSVPITATNSGGTGMVR